MANGHDIKPASARIHDMTSFFLIHFQTNASRAAFWRVAVDALVSPFLYLFGIAFRSASAALPKASVTTLKD